MSWGWGEFGDYVSAADKQRRADSVARKLEKQGRALSPVRPAGRSIADSFWGKAWCQNLESYGDYASRLPRGRSYLRQGAVLDLQIRRGAIKALVSGTQLYEVEIKIDATSKEAWTRLKGSCAGKVGSLMELLQGKLSASVMAVVTARDTGLFPKPKEIHLDCSCPDWADMCKHVSAVLYGVGARLDESPELLFVLRGVDHLELIASATESLHADLAAPATGGAATLDEGSLAEVFGIEMDEVVRPIATTPKPKRPQPPAPAARNTAVAHPKKRPAPPSAKKVPLSPAAPPVKTPTRKAPRAVQKPSASVSTPKKGRQRR